MITVKYRLIGSVKNPTLVKEFKSQAELDAWQAAQVNILILDIETSGKALAGKLNSLFGC